MQVCDCINLLSVAKIKDDNYNWCGCYFYIASFIRNPAENLHEDSSKIMYDFLSAMYRCRSLPCPAGRRA
ncbi:hypothetical protein CUC15_14180 [Oceanobacillus zhaokaii]|uniref:Uncharacterized protein n=1 Tax=Oceanobacillus zhaokaii TaxID=2052660 RepID=A0A345PJ23_9BACI|nr:hypothetical protein CUC15_14180 [Oceanobacillus zhaokaii]